MVRDVDKKPVKKEVIKLPWEQLTTFSDVLKALPGRQNEDEEEDDDELEAYEDTIQRLKVCYKDRCLEHQTLRAWVLRSIGSGLGYKEDVKRAICLLFGMSTSFFHI